MKYLFFILLIIYHEKLYAKADASGYVVKLFSQQNSALIDISNPISTKTLHYKSNTGYSTNLMLAKDGLSISFPTHLAKTSEEENFKMGKSTTSDYQFTFVKGWFGIDMIYQKYAGFYLNDTEFNTNKTDSTGKTISVSQQYSSLKLERQTINLYYLSNPEGFSYNAAFSQSERQTSSGGSWISMLSFSNFVIDNPSTFIPTNYQSAYGTLKRGKATGVSYLFGGAYTLTYGAPFITILLAGGPMKYFSTFDYQDKTIKRSRENARSLIRFAAGINGTTFIISAAITIDELSFKSEETKLNPMADSIQISFGLRF
jgi:hypothetical protein